MAIDAMRVGGRGVDLASDRHLVVRVDADARIGTGHVMRCLALAQEWRSAGGKVVFLMGDVSPPLKVRLHSEGMEVRLLGAEPGGSDDWGRTIAQGKEVGAVWVVVDGYHFGAEFQAALRRSGLRLLVIDDYAHSPRYVAEVLLNQNLSATPELYADVRDVTTLLLGSRYVLLRKEFLTYRGASRAQPTVARKVLVTLGGADPDNTTLKVLRALSGLGRHDMELKVLAGPVNPNAASLPPLLTSLGLCGEVVTAGREMPDLMAWADLAISSGGSTCWELAFMGVPALIVILAENQRRFVEAIEREEAGINLGWVHELTHKHIADALLGLIEDPARRESLSLRGRALVDGLGASRVREALSGGPC